MRGKKEGIYWWRDTAQSYQWVVWSTFYTWNYDCCKADSIGVRPPPPGILAWKKSSVSVEASYICNSLAHGGAVYAKALVDHGIVPVLIQGLFTDSLELIEANLRTLRTIHRYWHYSFNLRRKSRLKQDSFKPSQVCKCYISKGWACHKPRPVCI